MDTDYSNLFTCSNQNQFYHTVQTKLTKRTVCTRVSMTGCRHSGKKNQKAISSSLNRGKRRIKELPAPPADFSSPLLSSISRDSSVIGRRWSSSAPNWCSFLQASKHTSCFAFWLFRQNGPPNLWKTALGGNVKVHSEYPFKVLYSKVGLGV